MPCFFTTLSQRNAKRTYPESSTNFGHAMFLHYLEPEKCQKPTQKTAQISDTPCFFATLSQRNAKKPTQKTAQILDTPCFFATLSQRSAKNLPRKQHEFQQRHNSSLPRASKMPKNQPKDMNFVANCTH